MTDSRALLLVAGCAAAVAACGSGTSATPQTGSNRPLTASTVDVRPSGNTDFVVDSQSVTFHIDNAALLRMIVGVTSHATAKTTVTMTASLLDAGGTTVGAATGGAIDVEPGSHDTVELTGSRPTGVIAVVDLVIAGQPAPTSTS